MSVWLNKIKYAIEEIDKNDGQVNKLVNDVNDLQDIQEQQNQQIANIENINTEQTNKINTIETNITNIENINTTQTNNINALTTRVTNLENAPPGGDVLANGDNTFSGNNTFTRSINMSNNKITNVLNPTNGQDVATKSYVDSMIPTTPPPNEQESIYIIAKIKTDGLAPNATKTLAFMEYYDFENRLWKILTISSFNPTYNILSPSPANIIYMGSGPGTWTGDEALTNLENDTSTAYIKPIINTTFKKPILFNNNGPIITIKNLNSTNMGVWTYLWIEVVSMDWIRPVRKTKEVLYET